jgi:hypothetical protein
MGELWDIFVEEVDRGIKKVNNFLQVKEVQKVGYTPSLKPKIISYYPHPVRRSRRSTPHNPQIKSHSELEYLDRIENPQRRQL